MAEDEPLTVEQLEQKLNKDLIGATGEALDGLRQTSRALHRILNIRGVQFLRPINEQGRKLRDEDIPDNFKALRMMRDAMYLNIGVLVDMLEQTQSQITKEPTIENSCHDGVI